MLQNLRDKAQGWMAWIIITLIAITFVLFGASNFLDMGGSEQIAAKVNGQKITAREVDIQYENLLQQTGNEALRALPPKAVKKDILQNMIEQNVITQQALRSGMRISAEYLNNTIRTLPILQVDNKFSPEAYQRLLQNNNFTDKSFRALLTDDLLRGQLQQGIAQTAFATNADIDEAVRLMQQQRSFRISLFPKALYKSEVKISNDDVNAFYKAHLDDYKTEEKVKLAYVLLSLPDIAKRFQPTDKEIETYYKNHIKEFTQPEKNHIAHILAAAPSNADKERDAEARAKIESVQQQLKQGRSFGDIAKAESDDTGSAANGGVLAWFSKGEMLSEIDTAIAQLKPGEISPAIRTRFGYHVIQLLERHPGKVEDLKAVKNQIRDLLKSQMAEEQFTQAIDDLSTLAYDAPDSLQPAADKLGLQIHTTILFTQKDGPQEKLLQNPAVLAAAFNPSVIEDKNNSDVVKLDDAHYLVLRAMEYVPPLQKPLADVMGEVERQLIDERSSELAKQAALQAQSTLLQAKTTMLPELMKKYIWEENKNVVRIDNAVNTEILTAAFSLPALQSNELSMKTVSYNQGDTALVWLLGVQNGDPAALTGDEKERYRSSFNRHLGELDYALYAKGVSAKAKVKNTWDISDKADKADKADKIGDDI